MDDDYEDNYDDEDFDDENEDDLFADEKSSKGDSISDDDVALDAFMDGQMDAEYTGIPYSGYELSVDGDKLTDEQKDLYETEYLAGYQDQENLDEMNGND